MTISIHIVFNLFHSLSAMSKVLINSKVLIDVDDDKLKVRVHDEEVDFNVFKAMSHPRMLEVALELTCLMKYL